MSTASSASSSASNESTQRGSTTDTEFIFYETDDEGITIWYEKTFAGSRRCKPSFTEWGEAEKIQQCPSCEEFHSAHSPPVCFGCAMGLR